MCAKHPLVYATAENEDQNTMGIVSQQYSGRPVLTEILFKKQERPPYRRCTPTEGEPQMAERTKVL